METKLGKYCFFTPFKIFLMGAILSYLFGVIYILINPYTGDPCYMIGDPLMWIIFFYIIYDIIGGLSLFLIALNLFKTIRENKVLLFLTFFTYPILAFPYILQVSNFNFIHTIGIQAPLLIPTIYYYIRFKRKQASGELLEDYYYDYGATKQND